MDVTSNFTVLFHAINGDTIKEKNRNFNKFFLFLKSNIADEKNLNNFVKSIVPKTSIEEVFKVKIMIKLKCKEVLLDELKTCSSLLLKKILRDWQLFDELFSTIPATDVINIVLPHFSYSLKFKFLNGIRKYVKNENLLDEYFVGLEKKYGLKVAACVLTGCSINQIKSTVTKYKWKLSQSYLKEIFKKDNNFVEFYFDLMKEKDKDIFFTNAYYSTLKYVAKTDASLYWRLCDKYKLRIRFGKRMTPKMVKTHKNIAEVGHVGFEIFHYLKLFKTTKKEGTLIPFLLSFCPESQNKFTKHILNYHVSKFIENGTVTEQYSLITSTFSQKYGEELSSHPEYYTEDMLKITPWKERESILNHKVKNNEDLYYLYHTSISIPKIKKQLLHSSALSTRCQYVSHLYKTCAANKDERALIDILRFVLERYRNDVRVFNRFNDDILRWPYIVNLSDDHWRYIAKFRKVLDLSGSHSWTQPKFFEAYISYLIKNNKSISNIIREHAEEIIKGHRYSFVDISKRDYWKTYWDEIAKCLDTYKGHEEYKLLCLRFLYFIPSKEVSILDYKRFFDQIEKDDPYCIDIIKLGVKYNDDTMHDLFWKFSNIVDNRILLWYVRHRPDLLKQNLDKLPHTLNRYSSEKFLTEFEKICTPDDVLKIVTYTLYNIDNANYDNVATFVHILSILAPNKFLELILPFLPTSDGNIDLQETTAEKVSLQKAIVRALLNIHDLSESFPLLLKFCTGDYLKFGLKSLYKISHNIPELEVENYLNKFSNSPVGVRKHVLLLGKNLYTSEGFHELLKNWSEKEINLSMKNIIFKKTVQYFIENPSERAWLLLRDNLKNIDSDDRKMHDFLLEFHTFPPNYLPEYIKIIYKIISLNLDKKINGKKFHLLEYIPDWIISKLENEFLKETLRQSAFSSQNTNFHLKCIFHVEKERQCSLLAENFVQLRHYLDKNKFDLKKEVRSEISKFVLSFFTLTIRQKENQSLIEHFILEWSSIFSPENFIKEYMLIELACLYFASKFDVFNTGLKTGELLCKYISKYNNSIIDFFCMQVDIFLNETCIKTNEENLLMFIKGVFHEIKDANIIIALTCLLPKSLSESDNRYALYVPIIKAIEDCDLSKVQYHYDDYLNYNMLQRTMYE